MVDDMEFLLMVGALSGEPLRSTRVLGLWPYCQYKRENGNGRRRASAPLENGLYPKAGKEKTGKRLLPDSSWLGKNVMTTSQSVC